ncbi:hypothetical protein MJH54_30215, partial [Salmonella enterica subsp. enterica serovar Montevideo]|nr:hypothetical protein [Salmonella enterica subsp. enterica serovar Montevideo]
MFEDALNAVNAVRDKTGGGRKNNYNQTLIPVAICIQWNLRLPIKIEELISRFFEVSDTECQRFV